MQTAYRFRIYPALLFNLNEEIGGEFLCHRMEPKLYQITDTSGHVWQMEIIDGGKQCDGSGNRRKKPLNHNGLILTQDTSNSAA